MRSTGNTLSNQKYNLINKSPPTTAFSGGDASEDIELERYIRDKYERKTFMKSRKLPPLPYPTISSQGDPDKANFILGPGARSPSLESSSSMNLKPGQRVSGDSFERARSPASTASSVELPPPKPSRQSNSAANPFMGDQLRWTGLERQAPILQNPTPTSAYPITQDVLFSQPSMGTEYSLNMTSMNPFQNQSTFNPQPQPQPLPPVAQMAPLPPQPPQNPFDVLTKETREPTNFDLLPPTSMAPPSESQPAWNTEPSYNSTSSNMQTTPSIQSTLLSPPLQRTTFSQSSEISGQTSQNPFVSTRSMSPTNPFFPSQEPTYSSFTPAYPPQSQPQYQQQPQPLYQTHQAHQFQPSQLLQPINSNVVYPPPRMDKQSILNLFNSPPPPPPRNPTNTVVVPQFVQNQNGVSAWSQNGVQF